MEGAAQGPLLRMEGAAQDSGPTDVGAMEMPRAPDPLQDGQLSLSGISILDRLIKTCPVWLQLCMGAPQVVEILCREASGVFLVTRDVEVQCMVLWVRSLESTEATDVLRYNIREEKTMMYLEGSMLVFKDIFKLVAFYCISRDILPSVLKLPPAISGAQSLQDLEEISNLGTGFWDKDKNPSSFSQEGKSTAPGNLRSDHVRHGSRELGDCACEIEISAGVDRLWFVTPIFIEDCSNVDSSGKLPLANCVAKAETRLPKGMHRRPPPPPPTLHKPPLPSVPPSAPPPNYIRPQSDSYALRSPTQSRPSTSEREVPATETEPPPSETLTEHPTTKPPLSSSSGTPSKSPPSSGTPSKSPPSSGTPTEPKSSGTPSKSPPSSGTPTEPKSSGTPSWSPPSSGTPIEPQLTETPSKSPPSSETPSKPPQFEPPSSESPALRSSPEPPPSLDLCSSPKTSSHNLVDLLDHPVGSPPLVPTPELLPDPFSPAGTILKSLPPTSILSETDCPPLLTSHPKDNEDPQPEASPLQSLDVDLLKEPLKNMKINAFCNDSPQQGPPQAPSPVRAPPAVPRRRPSGKVPEGKVGISTMKDELEATARSPAPKSATPTSDRTGTLPKQHGAKEEHGKKPPPLPPPRKKKLSNRSSSVSPVKGKVDAKSSLETEKLTRTSESQINSGGGKAADRRVSRHKRASAPALNTSDPSLSSHGSDPTVATPEADSYSTSSADDEPERPAHASIKKSHSFMLDRAKNRLSIVSIANVFSAFMSADRKLQKKIAELAHDKDSYFGNLVQDYKAYSLEMMAKQSSSTEMLQEIRLMMTQLKSYLVQSTELKSMVDYSLYGDDRIDAIVEAALCKCVLKPLKSAIECYLREIHNKDGSLRLLTENQQVIQETTTTDLGVTTSVPDSGVMEKILHKFGTMHKTYSPEKKIAYLLKACKLIYDSMAAGNPGKPHGADDFLPVLMYVLAQCDLVALLLDVEYMMELMDPALQLGEGSYYLTTTYGALEHIKNYDKITVTRQLSVEVQDSIHRWEKRRTLNKARVSRSSIQDFITISFEELDSKTRTLATKADMNVAEVVRQCAEKFEVPEAADYGLFVLVNERCVRLAEDAFPQQVKSRLLKNEQKLDFHFLYKRSGAQDTVMSELHFL